MNLAEAAAGKLRQVGPWPDISLTTQDFVTFLAVLGGGGFGIIAASEQGRLSVAAALVGIGFPLLCLVWGVADGTPELFRGGAIEFGSFVAGYLGMTLSRRNAR